MAYADILDELMAGQAPSVDPYQLILEDYIATWIADIAEALKGSPSKLYRAHRQQALAETVAGMLGEYEDHLLSVAAQIMNISPVSLWVQIYATAYRQAKEGTA